MANEQAMSSTIETAANGGASTSELAKQRYFRVLEVINLVYQNEFLAEAQWSKKKNNAAFKFWASGESLVEKERL